MSNAELFKTARELEIDSDHLSLSQLRKILEDKHQNKDVKNQPDAEVANEIESVQLIKETCVDENGNKFSWLRVGALEFAEEKWSTGVHLLSKTKLYTGNEKKITIPTTARHTHEGIPTTASPTTSHARYYNPTFENDLDIACCTEDIARPSNQQHQESDFSISSILTEEVISQNAKKPPRPLYRSHTTPHFYHDNDENGKSPKFLWDKLRKYTLGRRNKIEQNDSDKSVRSAWTNKEIESSASNAPDISIPRKHVQLSKISGRGRVIDFLGSDESKRTAMWLIRRGIKVRRTIRSTQVGSSCGYIAVYAAWALHKAAKRGEDWATCKIKDPSDSKDWIENQNQILSLEYLDRDFSEQPDVAKPLLNKEILFLLHHCHDLEYSDGNVPMTWFHGTLSSNYFREGVQDHIKNFQLESEFTGSSKLRIAIVNSTNSAQGQHWFTVAYQLHK
ncbi:unnamed protein product [Clavelina lepadiformis]|uniref:Uncharacterized protein n=1 Tax=Clavelina lepadiformis TaxID=159417 RepID=A0ABP0F2R5_CLALP